MIRRTERKKIELPGNLCDYVRAYVCMFSMSLQVRKQLNTFCTYGIDRTEPRSQTHRFIYMNISAYEHIFA